MSLSRRGGVDKGNSFMLSVNYRWQDHMLVGTAAKAVAHSPMTPYVCVCVCFGGGGGGGGAAYLKCSSYVLATAFL